MFVAHPTDARAQSLSSDADADADAAMAPVATLDRSSDRSYFGADAAYTSYDSEFIDFNMRLDLYGQYIAPNGFGGFASLPVSYLSITDASETAIGALELGGLYVARTRPLTWLFRAGLTLDTADDNIAGVVTNVVAMPSRLTDLAQLAPNTTLLRLSVSPVWQSGKLFARADAGLDIPLDSEGGSSIARLNLAAGGRVGPATIAAELVTIGFTGDIDEGDQRFFHSAALTVSGDLGGGVQPYVALVVPLDDVFSDETVGLSFAVMAGLRVRF